MDDIILQAIKEVLSEDEFRGGISRLISDVIEFEVAHELERQFRLS